MVSHHTFRKEVTSGHNLVATSFTRYQGSVLNEAASIERVNVRRQDVTLSLFNLPCVTCRMYVFSPSKLNPLPLIKRSC